MGGKERQRGRERFTCLMFVGLLLFIAYGFCWHIGVVIGNCCCYFYKSCCIMFFVVTWLVFYICSLDAFNSCCVKFTTIKYTLVAERNEVSREISRTKFTGSSTDFEVLIFSKHFGCPSLCILKISFKFVMSFVKPEIISLLQYRCFSNNFIHTSLSFCYISPHF